MMMLRDPALLWLVGGVVSLLVLGSVAGAVLQRVVTGPSGVATVANLNARVKAWWIMCAVFGVAVATGGVGSIVLFAFLSFWALREYMTIAPTGSGDHRALVWIFFLVTPLQYWLIYVRWYG